MLVAKITKDHEEEIAGFSLGFDYGAMAIWWGWSDCPQRLTILASPKVDFRLYDDDNILYYSGWLYNDPNNIVQQFVLRWAEVDSGCTLLEVNNPDVGWTQEIG